MNREQLLRQLASRWDALQASYAGLTDAQMTAPGVTGDWSVKDILAHVTTWDAEALKYLPVILDGRRPPRYSVMYGGIDAFNAQVSAQKQALSLQQVLHELADTHRQLVDYLQGVPEEQLLTDTPFRKRLRQDTYGHYALHTRALREWRARSA